MIQLLVSYIFLWNLTAAFQFSWKYYESRKSFLMCFVKGKVLKHTLEHPYHRQISGQIFFRISSEISKRWVCSPKSDRNSAGKTSFLNTRLSIAFLNLLFQSW